MAGKKGKRGMVQRSSFGQLLQTYRRRGQHPLTQDPLTQEQFAEMLDSVAGLPGFSHSDVSRWEKGLHGREIIGHEDRRLLVGIMRVLYECGGLATAEEANDLLQQGGYRALDEDEMAQIDATWTLSATSDDDLPDAVAPSGHTGLPLGFQTGFAQVYPAVGHDNRFSQGGAPPFVMPSLPPQGVVGREATMAKIWSLLRVSEPETVNVPPLALRGMGGIGKTTLSIALGRQAMGQRYFPDGVLWVALGPDPTPRLLLEEWGRVLGLDLTPELDEAGCQNRLRAVLAHRRVLLIVDDIWEVQHGRYFDVAGPYCRTLLTTRELPVAHHLATRARTLPVDVLSPEASLQLLHRLAPEAVAANEREARQLCERLEYLPLALTLAGRFLANEADVPSRLQRVLDELLEQREARLQLLQTEGRAGVDEANPVTLQAVLGLSVSRLTPLDQERFAMASLFGGKPLTWDIEAAAYVWACSQREAEDSVAAFAKRGLIERLPDGLYWMHALLVDYAAAMMDELGL